MIIQRKIAVTWSDGYRNSLGSDVSLGVVIDDSLYIYFSDKEAKDLLRQLKQIYRKPRKTDG